MQLLGDGSGRLVRTSRLDYPYISAIFGGTEGIAVGADMIYSISNEQMNVRGYEERFGRGRWHRGRGLGEFELTLECGHYS